jgi:hypothetical protein
MAMTAPETITELRVENERLKEEGFTLAAALHTVLGESSDAESCRTAVAALMGTNLGRTYLDAHPMRF